MESDVRSTEDQMTADNELDRLRADVQRLEQELERVRGTLDDSQRLAHVGSWEWDLRTGNVFWSDEMYRLLRPRAGGDRRRLLDLHGAYASR